MSIEVHIDWQGATHLVGWLNAAESKKILREVFSAVSGWRKTGRQLHLSAAVLDTYASAFEHPLMAEAASLLG